MEEDEIIIINHNTSNNSQKNSNKKKKKKKAVKKSASNINAKKDKNKVRALNKINNKGGKKAKIITIFLLAIVAIILILTSDLFNVKEIEVKGNSKLTKEQVISLSRIEKENNIFKVSKKKTKENLKEEAYIESSNIKMKFPNKIEIEVKERVPKYMLQFADSFVYINNQGYMLEITNIPLEIPILLGVVTDLSNIHTGNRMDIEDLKKMEKVIKIVEVAKANDIASLITKIDISDEDNYTLILETEGKKVYLGEGTTELNTRILLLKKIIELEEGHSGEVFLNVDLNSEDVYFRESVNV